MTPPTMTSRKALLAVLLAGTMALTVGACGRRGRPEPPVNPDAAKTQQGKTDKSKAKGATQAKAGNAGDDDDDEPDNDQPVVVSPQPTPPSGRKKTKPFEVPNQPFILDSLL